MTDLFDPLTLGALSLPNRIVMAPMTRSRNDDNGVPTDIMVDYYRQRASAGLIISEAIFVSPDAKGYSRIPGLFSPAQVARWRRVTDAVHAAGGRILAQIVHCGRVCVPVLLPAGVAPVAPSAIAINGKNYTDQGPQDFIVPRALETGEIAGIVGEFVTAARNAIAAGFDGVELHAASGYLVHQFLDASINRRDDRYGGSVENRIRFALDVVDGITGAVGRERFGIKISPRIKFNDIVEPDAEEIYPALTQALSARGIAYLHGARQGAYEVHSPLRPLFKGAYLAGSAFEYDSGMAMLREGGADAIVYGKLFVANPDLPRRFREGLPLAESDPKAYYSTGPKGYSDFPAA